MVMTPSALESSRLAITTSRRLQPHRSQSCRAPLAAADPGALGLHCSSQLDPHNLRHADACPGHQRHCRVCERHRCILDFAIATVPRQANGKMTPKVLQSVPQPTISVPPGWRTTTAASAAPCRKVQAGGLRSGEQPRVVLVDAVTRQRYGAGADGRTSVEPGRSMTAIGIRLAIACQRCQRWKSRRLSAPMIQTKSTPGRAPSRSASVSAV